MPKVAEKKQDFPKPQDPKGVAPETKTSEVVTVAAPKPVAVKTENTSEIQALEKTLPEKKSVDEEMESAETSKMESMEKKAGINQEVPPPEDKKKAEKGLNLLMMVQEELNEKAANDSKEEDLRRAQLAMRASEKGKLEEERESKKAKKKKDVKAKPKGRPRKVQGEAEDKPKRSKEVESEDEEEGEAEASGSRKKRKTRRVTKKRKQREDEAEPSAPAPKAKAKAKAGPKRAPRARGPLPNPDPTMKKEMIDLMKRYHEVPYDKLKDVLHKVYTKKNANPYSCIYWNRPAGGVKIVLEDKSETQRFYFSYCYSSIAVHIYMCNKVCQAFAGAAPGWWDSKDAIFLEQLLLVTAAEAEKEFGDWKQNVD